MINLEREGTFTFYLICWCIVCILRVDTHFEIINTLQSMHQMILHIRGVTWKEA